MKSWNKALSILLLFIAIFHLMFGAGLMFSVSFQEWILEWYGVETAWTTGKIYFTRILGSFAFVLGTIALPAARNPLKYEIIVIGFIEFFILRNLHRHLYYNELSEAFQVSSTINILTSIFFGLQAVALIVLLWQAKKEIQTDSD